MWFSQQGGSELYDFELEPGGAQIEWGCNDQTDELRRTLLYLVHENNSMLVKLRGLSALREVLQRIHVKQEQDEANFSESALTLGAEKSQGRAGAGAKPLSQQNHRDEKLQKDIEQVCCSDDDYQQEFYGSSQVGSLHIAVLLSLVKCNSIPTRSQSMTCL